MCFLGEIVSVLFRGEDGSREPLCCFLGEVVSSVVLLSSLECFLGEGVFSVFFGDLIPSFLEGISRIGGIGSGTIGTG